jgi:hypothetical protein
LEAGIGLRLIGHWNRCLSAYSTALGGQDLLSGREGATGAKLTSALPCFSVLFFRLRAECKRVNGKIRLFGATRGLRQSRVWRYFTNQLVKTKKDAVTS